MICFCLCHVHCISLKKKVIQEKYHSLFSNTNLKKWQNWQNVNKCIGLEKIQHFSFMGEVYEVQTQVRDNNKRKRS